jgi:hypothetical protein
MSKRFAIAILCCASACLPAQQLPSVGTLLQRITACVKQYRASLPSFEVDESAVSQRLKNGQVKSQVALEMTLREIRDPSDPDNFNDSYTFRLVNGKPPKGRFKLPYFVTGGFSNAIGFAQSGQDNCYDYRVQPGRDSETAQLDFWVKSAPLPANCTDVIEGYRKSVIVDIATGTVLHVTRSMPARSARPRHEVDFVEVDYAPQKLGDETFYLPVRLESHDEKNERRMIVTYSNFHRYAATSRIVSSDPMPEIVP